MTPNRQSALSWVLEYTSEHTKQEFFQLGKVISFPRKTLCIHAGEEISNIFFILDGKVQIYNLTKCGKKKILFILGRHSIANESLLSGSSTIYCETLEPCHFFVIRQKALLSLMEKDFGLTRRLLQYQERKIWRLQHQLKNTVGSIYLERKLAAKLWKLSRDFGTPTDKGIMIDLDISITFLADLLGAPRETTSRTCKKLSEYGLIALHKRRIYVIDKENMVCFYKTGIPPIP